MNDPVFSKYLDDRDSLFIEVGAFNGINWSPCIELIDAGWHGIMIEPNPVTFQDLVRNRGGNSKLQLVNAAASSALGEGMLYEGGSLSTLCRHKLDLYNSLPAEQGWNVHLDPGTTHRCRIVTLDHLLFDSAQSDLPSMPAVISIDAEGSELAVLQGLSIGYYRPKLFIIETHEGHHRQELAEDFPAISSYLAQFGYQNIGHDQTNTIYWRGH